MDVILMWVKLEEGKNYLLEVDVKRMELQLVEVKIVEAKPYKIFRRTSWVML